MAFNNFQNPTHFNSNQQNYQAQTLPQNFQQQNVQPLFPQPQGNVYNINSTLEVANVPVGAGISVALCLNEGFMYIKTMQNGNPLFWAYKITPYDNSKPVQQEEELKPEENPLVAQLEQFDNRFNELEKQIVEIKASMKKKGGWDL